MATHRLSRGEFTRRSRCPSRCAALEPRRSPTASTNASTPRVEIPTAPAACGMSGALSSRAARTALRVERKVAVRIERLLEVGRTVERRHPEKRREPVPRVDPLAMFDLLIERQRGTEMGVDAARSLRLALRQPQQPAVVEKLPLRL